MNFSSLVPKRLEPAEYNSRAMCQIREKIPPSEQLKCQSYSAMRISSRLVSSHHITWCNSPRSPATNTPEQCLGALNNRQHTYPTHHHMLRLPKSRYIYLHGESLDRWFRIHLVHCSRELTAQQIQEVLVVSALKAFPTHNTSHHIISHHTTKHKGLESPKLAIRACFAMH
jgi:hypothetical protein